MRNKIDKTLLKLQDNIVNITPFMVFALVFALLSHYNIDIPKGYFITMCFVFLLGVYYIVRNYNKIGE